MACPDFLSQHVTCRAWPTISSCAVKGLGAPHFPHLSSVVMPQPWHREPPSPMQEQNQAVRLGLPMGVGAALPRLHLSAMRVVPCVGAGSKPAETLASPPSPAAPPARCLVTSRGLSFSRTGCGCCSFTQAHHGTIVDAKLAMYSGDCHQHLQQSSHPPRYSSYGTDSAAAAPRRTAVLDVHRPGRTTYTRTAVRAYRTTNL